MNKTSLDPGKVLLDAATLDAWLASGEEILAERERDNERWQAAEAERRRAEYAPQLAALRAQLPAWAHELITPPDPEGGVFHIAVPGLPPVKAVVCSAHTSGELEVSFATITRLTTGSYWWHDYNEPRFPVALAQARRVAREETPPPRDFVPAAPPEPDMIAQAGLMLQSISAGDWSSAAAEHANIDADTDAVIVLTAAVLAVAGELRELRNECAQFANLYRVLP